MRLVVLVAVVGLATAACGDSDSGDSDSGERVGLAGTRWALGSLDGTPVIAGSNAALTFGTSDAFQGTTGCNGFSGGYTTDGSSISLEVGPMTRALCDNDELQAQEGAFLAALDAATAYTATDDTLTLSDASGEVATFSVLEDSIAGSAWSVVAINNGNQGVVGLVPGSEITAIFGTEGDVTGSSGCNDYTGVYTTEASGITLAPTGTTQKACAPEVDNQESQFLEAMLNTATFTLAGPDRLEFRSADGDLQVSFIRATGG